MTVYLAATRPKMPMHFVSVVFTLPPPSHRGSVWVLPASSLILTNTVPVHQSARVFLSTVQEGLKWGIVKVKSTTLIDLVNLTGLLKTSLDSTSCGADLPSI